MTEWDRCRPWIEAALTDSGWTFEEIKTGDFYLFSRPDGCMVAEVISSPRTKVFHVFANGGVKGGRGLRAAAEMIPEVEAFGRALGCVVGGATGRKGWVRFLKKHGYQPADVAVQKEL